MASILKVDTIQDQSGNNIINESSDTITIGASGDTITIPSGATISNLGTASGFGTNTPAFFATMSADQTSIADSTFTKVQFNSERFDTNSAYDPTTNYRFTVPAGQGGKYFFSSILFLDGTGVNHFLSVDYAFYINGTQNLYSANSFSGSLDLKNYNVSVNGLFDLSAGDYVEMFIYADISGGGTFNVNQDGTTLARCFWYGYKLI